MAITPEQQQIIDEKTEEVLKSGTILTTKEVDFLNDLVHQLNLSLDDLQATEGKSEEEKVS